MKRIDAYLIFSILIIIILSANLLLRKPISYSMYLNSIDRSKEVVLDEEMARKIAEFYCCQEGMGRLHLDEDINYDVEVDFDEQRNEWRVYFSPKQLMLDGSVIIRIRKDNGLFTDFGT